MKVAERADEVFVILGLQAVAKPGNGRYNLSKSLQEGVVYWSTSSDREQTDCFGLEFSGNGQDVYHVLKSEFDSRGFRTRTSKSETHITVYKGVPRKADDAVDGAALSKIKSELDSILNIPRDFLVRGLSIKGFVDFMKSSPLAGVDLAVPSRTVEPERDIF